MGNKREWNLSRYREVGDKWSKGKPNQGNYKVDQSGLPDGMKRCSGCLEVLPLENYYKASTCYLGRHNLCKTCWNMKYSSGSDDTYTHRKKMGDWYDEEILSRDWLIVLEDPEHFWPKYGMFKWLDFITSLAEGNIWTDGMILLRRSDATRWMVKGTALLSLTQPTETRDLRLASSLLCSLSER